MPKKIKFSTPLHKLWPTKSEALAQLETPQCSAIFAVYYYCQEQGLPCNLGAISSVFNILKSTSSDVLASGRCPRLQNSDEDNPRSGLQLLSHQDAEAIAQYIREAPFDEKSDPWRDLAGRAGVVKEYRHEREAENMQFHSTVIQRRVTQQTGIKTHKAVVKEKHTKEQVEARKLSRVAPVKAVLEYSSDT
jgi:hypothetical protein